MRFTPGPIEGLMVIDLEPIGDHRGFFARVWCEDEFARQGLVASWRQSNLQFSPAEGTMRGLHLQTAPHQEVKLVRCTAGSVFDVAVDLRPESASYLTWFGTVLDPGSRQSVWIPGGCAHGYVTLEPESEVFYLTSHSYVPESATGIRYDDPAIDIAWPRTVDVIADRDLSWPFLEQ